MLAKVLENLEEVRRERGVTAYDLSVKVGKEVSYWSKVRSRKRRLTLNGYIEITRVLDVSPSKLLRDSLNGKDVEIVL